MTDFIVHSVAGSPYGRAVLATLVEKGASYRFAPVAPGGNRQEPHVSRHPFGRVPVLEHDGWTERLRRVVLDRAVGIVGGAGVSF